MKMLNLKPGEKITIGGSVTKGVSGEWHLTKQTPVAAGEFILKMERPINAKAQRGKNAKSL